MHHPISNVGRKRAHASPGYGWKCGLKIWSKKNEVTLHSSQFRICDQLWMRLPNQLQHAQSHQRYHNWKENMFCCTSKYVKFTVHNSEVRKRLWWVENAHRYWRILVHQEPPSQQTIFIFYLFEHSVYFYVKSKNELVCSNLVSPYDKVQIKALLNVIYHSLSKCMPNATRTWPKQIHIHIRIGPEQIQRKFIESWVQLLFLQQKITVKIILMAKIFKQKKKTITVNGRRIVFNISIFLASNNGSDSPPCIQRIRFDISADSGM